jgi:hypothetical protein
MRQLNSHQPGALLKYSKSKRVSTPSKPGPSSADPPKTAHPDEVLRLKHSRNRANTIRNSAKVEHFLMEVERAQGFAKSWALRERLELGHVTLEEAMRR